MENNNFKFKELGDKLKLSKTEKGFYRDEILKFIDRESPVQTPYYKKETASPFYFGIFARKHFVLTSLVIISFLSTGLVVSADQALPNDYLYQMKVKIIESAQILLAPTVEKKNNLRIKFVDNALKDFSQVSVKEEINQADKTALIESVSSNIGDLNDDISKLVGENDTSNSLKTVNDLKSVLSAHSIVLDKISESNPEIDNTETLSSKIDEGLNKTEDTINTLTEMIQTSEDTTKLDQTISDQKEEINATLNDIKDVTLDNSTKQDQSETIDTMPKDIKDINLDNSTNNVQDITLDSTKDKGQDIASSDPSNVDLKLLEINAIKEEGDKKLAEGKKDEAFMLYNQVDQKLGELKSLIDSEQKLNIDVLSNGGGSKQ